MPSVDGIYVSGLYFSETHYIDVDVEVCAICLSGPIGVREDGAIEASSGVDVMEEEEGDDEDDNDDDDHDDEEDEGGSDMDEDGADMIGDDSFRIYEEDDIYLPFDEGSGR